MLSQHEDHFHGWGLAVMIIGAIVFGAHAAVYVLATMGFSDITAYWIPRGVMFALILALFCFGLRYWKHGLQQPVQEVETAPDPPER